MGEGKVGGGVEGVSTMWVGGDKAGGKSTGGSIYNALSILTCITKPNNLSTLQQSNPFNRINRAMRVVLSNDFMGVR